MPGLSGGFGFQRSFSLERGDMQTGKSHAALIVKPHHHTAALGVEASVIRRGDAVAVPAAGDNEKRLESPRLQTLTNISDHACCEFNRIHAKRVGCPANQVKRHKCRGSALNPPARLHKPRNGLHQSPPHPCPRRARSNNVSLRHKWRHLANAQILKRREREAQRADRPLPHVCTPLELMGGLPYAAESAA